ncbi:MAG: ABC transporter ATP-binding protein/permease [candidate division WOR-3 bacterium]|nr:ABC transporter ATP-binding protein/permease [candidate division WOR-3 bacterium]
MWWHGEEEAIVEEEQKGKRDIRLIKKLIPYFRPYVKKIIIATLLLLVSTILSLFGPVLIKRVIDYEIPQKDITGLLVITLIYLTMQGLIILIRYFQQIEIAMIGERAIADLKFDLFKHTLTLPVGFFDRNPVGRLITRVEGDAETLKNLFSSTAVILAQDFILLMGMSVIMIAVNYKLYLLILSLLPIFLYAFWWFGKNVRPVYVEVRKKIAEINSFVTEVLKALPVIQVFLQEENFSNRLNSLGKDKFDLEMKSMLYWYRIWFLVDLGEIIGIILILGVGGLWALQAKITIGTLFLFITYITRFFGPLRGLSDQVNLIERSFAAAERIFNILTMPPEFEKNEDITFSVLSNKIKFDNVRFSYENEEWVLKDLNFEIKKGERIALVGETGGGKTSIISLLLKFYKPGMGEIFIDGVEINRLNRYSLRKKIGFVPQDVILFPGTILDNLRLFNNSIPAEKVFAATKRIGIHERIMHLPQGYDTDIIEQGINLSFGERQLLSFARALVFDPEIIILDEATSAVDPQSERVVQDGLKELLQERTAIIIAHRLTTTRLADRILVIHKGKLVEQGSHHELLKKKGFYYNFYRLQYLQQKAG